MAADSSRLEIRLRKGWENGYIPFDLSYTRKPAAELGDIPDARRLLLQLLVE